MKNDVLKIDKKAVMALFQKSDEAGKTLIKEMYPEVDFQKELQDKISSWDEICEAYMKLQSRETEEPHILPYPDPKTPLDTYTNGCRKVAILNYLICGGKIPDMLDGKSKFWIWWEYGKPGFRFGYAMHDWAATNATVGPRLCFYESDREKVLEWIEPLTHIYEEMFGQPK